MSRRVAARVNKAAKASPVVEALERLLADSYTMYLKTHNYHWNVTGPMFNTLHSLFMVEYTELALAVDLIAERIRSLGERAPGSYAEFARLSAIKEETGTPSARQMVENLLADQATLVAAAKQVVEAAEVLRDQASADLAIRRIEVHEKNAWMLRSHLE
jgi:starvation-inducible DNA-binding protein